MSKASCSYCKDVFECDHLDDHPELCCECLDLSCGKPLDLVNASRALLGRSPVKPWPGRNEDGSKQRDER